MANSKGHLKLTGDTHLPDVESELDVEEGLASLSPLARERTQPGRPNVVRRAGLLRDQDDATASDGTAARAPLGTGEEAMPSISAARPSPRVPMRPAAGPMQTLAAPGATRWGTIAMWAAGAWLLLKLVRR